MPAALRSLQMLAPMQRVFFGLRFHVALKEGIREDWVHILEGGGGLAVMLWGGAAPPR